MLVRFVLGALVLSLLRGSDSLSISSIMRPTSYYRTYRINLQRIPQQSSNTHFLLGYVVIEPPNRVQEASYTVTEKCEYPVYAYRYIHYGWLRFRRQRYIAGYQSKLPRVIAGGYLNLTMSPPFQKFYECERLFPFPRDDSKSEINQRCYVDLKITIRLAGGYIPFDYPRIGDSCNIYPASKDGYTADCNFANGDTCDYTSDGCSFGQWSADDGRKDLAASSIESCDLLSNNLLDMVTLKASNLSAMTYTNIIAVRGRINAVGLILSPSGKTDVSVGICNTPTLTAHPGKNKAMKFSFTFYPKGVHQIVVLLLCMSRRSEVIPLRKDLRHYEESNFKPLGVYRHDTRCLDIHAYLKGVNFECTKFQVQFMGAAKGSPLVITDVSFDAKSTCPGNKYHNLENKG